MSRSMQIAAAVAAALGVSATSFAAPPPSLSAAASAAITLYVAGSSAAKNGIISALQTNLCGSAANALTISSTGNTNFFAVSCTVAASSGLSFAGQVATVYYRDEGGSVVGALDRKSVV